MDLHLIWFLLVGVLLGGYAILDGFDLGVGILHLFAKSEEERRIHMNAIGPVWDGNEVWLLTGGGALFAAFPPVYAGVFSALYLALMLLLVALIFRATSFEFRSKVEDARWKKFWDYAFGFGSLVSALLLSVAFGNILRGMAVDSNAQIHASFLGLLNPFSLLIGLFGLAALTMHGAAYMSWKTEGDLQIRMRRWISKTWVVFILLFIGVTIYGFFAAPHLYQKGPKGLVTWLFFLLLLGGLIYIPLANHAKKAGRTFLATSVVIGSAFGLATARLFPRLVPSTLNLEDSLTAYTHSSSDYTLKVMLVIALVGMPLVIGYTVFIYRKFKGKVIIDEHSY